MRTLKTKNKIEDAIRLKLVYSTALLALPLLSACGAMTTAAPTTAASPTPVASTYLYVNGFSPASGTTSLPKTVVVNFSETLGSSAAAVSNWSYSCVSAATASNTPTSVTINGSTATVALPNVSGQSASTACTLTLTSAITSANGDSLASTPTAVYGQNSGGSSASNYSFVGYFNNLRANQIVTGSTSIQAGIFSGYGTNVAPAKVEFVLGNSSGALISLNYVNYSGQTSTYNFLTALFPNGSYTLHLNAYDANGNVYADIATPLPVTIANMSPATAQDCAQANGVSFLAAGVSICKVPASTCPGNMVAYGDGNWTITTSVSCDGGSTTNCGSGHKTGNTGFHSIFEDVAPETISEPQVLACGPANSGNNNVCTANVVAIGCVDASDLNN